MISSRTLIRYIDQCDNVISQNNISAAKELQKEILAVFSPDLEGLKRGLSNYAPRVFCSTADGKTQSTGKDVDWIDDIKLLKSRLISELEKGETMPENLMKKASKVFISHASKDIAYVKAMTELLEDIGLTEEQMVCSSVPGYGIPLGADIYEWLSQQFQNYNLHVLFMLSSNYYTSVACLNEMGAAWVLKQRYDSVLLPGFEYKEIKGAVNANQISIKLDGENAVLKQHLNELKDNLVAEFSLHPLSASKWERHRDAFIDKVNKEIEEAGETQEEQPAKKQNSLTIDAGVLLVYAANDSTGRICVLKSLTGTSISAGQWEFLGADGSAREEARWIGAVEELEKYGLIEVNSYKRQVFTVTRKGYEVADEVKNKLDINVQESPDHFLHDKG